MDLQENYSWQTKDIFHFTPKKCKTVLLTYDEVLDEDKISVPERHKGSDGSQDALKRLQNLSN